MVVALNISVLYSSIEINQSALKHGFSPADINHIVNSLSIFRHGNKAARPRQIWISRKSRERRMNEYFDLKSDQLARGEIDTSGWVRIYGQPAPACENIPEV